MLIKIESRIDIAMIVVGHITVEEKCIEKCVSYVHEGEKRISQN